MRQSYLIIAIILLSVSFLIDISFPKLLLKKPKQLIITCFFLYVFFLFRIYMGIKMHLWSYGNGILDIYFLDIPIEEYIFMAIAPYATIVLWETFHILIKKR